MKQLPKSVNIFGQRFKVEIKSLKDGVYGKTHTLERKIVISNEYPIESQWSTLLHEIIHAALGVSGQAELMNDESKEEALVLCLENALHPLFQFRGKK